MRFLEEVRQVGGRNVAADLAALLPQRQNLRIHRLRLFEPPAAVRAYCFTREQRQQNAARQFSGTAGILRESQFEAPQNCGDGLAALLRSLQGRANLAEPYLA